MHPILPFYAFFSLWALFGLQIERSHGRASLRFAAWGSMAVVLFAAIFREISGDTWRYTNSFHRLAGLSFSQMWSQTNNNWLFELTMWGLAQLGSDPIWFIFPVTLFCIAMMRHSLRMILGPTDTAVAILLYSAYPFFVFYVASGIKQAIAMALLMQGYVALYQGRNKVGLVWLALAPLFHSGAVLVFPFLLLHILLWRRLSGHSSAYWLSIALLGICTGLSFTGLNRTLMAPVQAYTSFTSGYDIYFIDATTFGYRAGFRLDFTLFSFLPLAVAWWLRRCGEGLRAEVSGWWLNLYMQLACIYQLFAFAPFADRFAAFGWYIIPALVVIMLADTRALWPRQVITLAFAFLNILILQFYTGDNLRLGI